MTAARSRARALADLATGVIVACVDIMVSRERVFRAITDPRELAAWWGSPETYRAHKWEADFRVGGRWIVEGKGADGAPYSVCGEYLEIYPPKHVVQTWQHDWDAGHPPTKITYTLDEIPGGTRLTVRHEGFGENHESCNRHANGWERVLAWLQAYAEGVAQPGL